MRDVLTSSGQWTPPQGVTSVDVVIVAGGGGGGRAGSGGAGGSGGQVRYEQGVTVTPGLPVTVTVGAGGAGRTGSTGPGATGEDSAFGPLTAIGGGGGGGGGAGQPTRGAYGGGGQGSSTTPRTGATGLVAHKGGDGANANAAPVASGAPGGGGGAGGPGLPGVATSSVTTGGSGGPGVDLSAVIGTDLGVSGWLGGGGGAGVQSWLTTPTPGAGGTGGGGSGGGSVPPTGGTPGTGGGGGGGAGDSEDYTVTDGADGGSGLVVVLYDDTPEPVAPVITTAHLTSPEDRWQGKATRLTWWDGSRWGAVLPTDVGHVIYPDLTDLDTPGPVVDARQTSRVSVAAADGVLYAVRGHASATRFSSYDMGDGCTPIVTDVTVPITSPDLDAAPVTLHRSPDGHLWAATMVGGQVQVTRSTDGGATWGTAQTVATLGTVTGVAAMTTTATTVVLVATANDGAGRTARRIALGSASYAPGSWTTETLPALPSGVTSDDHLDVDTLPDGRVIAVTKTTGATSSDHPLLQALIRSTTGTWTATTIEPGPDTGQRYTRPTLAVEPGTVRVVYGQITVPAPLHTRTGGPTTWGPRQTLIATGDRSNGAVAPAPDHIAATPGDYPVLADDSDTHDVTITWVTPTARTATGASVATITTSATGSGARRTVGASVTRIAPTTPGAGHRVQHAPGSSPTITVTAAGSGSRHTTGADVAGIQVTARTQGHRHTTGRGTTPLTITTTGSGRRVHSGAGGSVTPVHLTPTGHGTRTSAGASTTTTTVSTASAGHRATPHRGASTTRLDVTTTGRGQRLTTPTGASTTRLTITTTGHGHTTHHGAATTTVTLTTHGRGHDPAAPDDTELTITRGPYRRTIHVTGPYGTPLNLTGPRR